MARHTWRDEEYLPKYAKRSDFCVIAGEDAVRSVTSGRENNPTILYVDTDQHIHALCDELRSIRSRVHWNAGMLESLDLEVVLTLIGKSLHSNEPKVARQVAGWEEDESKWMTEASFYGGASDYWDQAVLAQLMIDRVVRVNSYTHPRTGKQERYVNIIDRELDAWEASRLLFFVEE